MGIFNYIFLLYSYITKDFIYVLCADKEPKLVRWKTR
jgi:hypothetical protein